MENTYEYIINNYMLDDIIYVENNIMPKTIKEYENKNVTYIFGQKHIFSTDFLKKEIENINHFCYRNNIPVLLKNKLDNDIGWGCMIRTGQMMLCKVLKEYYSDAEVWFYDTPEAYFSIHNITLQGEKNYIPCGNWFNPTGLAHTLKQLVNENNHISKKIKIVVGRDGYLYNNEIEENYTNGISSLILIPIMLGIDKINDNYVETLLNCFELKQNAGIVGGKPRQSFYFIGKQKENIFFLDPHIVKNALLYNNNKNSQENDMIKYIDVFDIDPCMLLCFLVKTRDDYEEFKIDVINKINNTEFSLFTLVDKENNEKEIDDDMDFDESNDKSNDKWIEI
jgi:cysteine protease ATG4